VLKFDSLWKITDSEATDGRRNNQRMGTAAASKIIAIDTDACPVKQEIYPVAERHALKSTALKVLVVSNSPIAVPRDEMIERVERV
jgi:hypothetical protein